MVKLTKEQRLQNKLKEVEIKEREANANAKLAEIEEKKIKTQQEEAKLVLDKLEALRYLACMLTFDEGGISGMEQKLKPIMDESEMQTIKDKIFEIIPKL